MNFHFEARQMSQVSYFKMYVVTHTNLLFIIRADILSSQELKDAKRQN